MMAVAIGVAWAGYALGIWGYCLVRGYDVPFTGIFKPVWPGGGDAGGQSGPVPLPPDPGTGTFLA